MHLFLSPHNDDETLFGAYTLMREKPLVVIVTDSYVQQNRGENITPQQRFQESVNAMKVLGCPVMRLGIRDDVIDEVAIIERLAWFKNFDKVYAPAIQGGNPVHDLVGKCAEMVFKDRLVQYSTYAKGEWITPFEVKEGSGVQRVMPPDPHEDSVKLKEKALSCYESQIKLMATKPHFEAVKGQDEWIKR